jgi:CrcB protein
MQLKFLKALKVSISSVSLGIISFAFGFLLVNQ